MTSLGSRPLTRNLQRLCQHIQVRHRYVLTQTSAPDFVPAHTGAPQVCADKNLGKFGGGGRK